MAYYATVINGTRVGFLAGPFNTHGAALRAVPLVQEKAEKIDDRACWYSYGTTHVRTGRHRVGSLNACIEMPMDSLP